MSNVLLTAYSYTYTCMMLEQICSGGSFDLLMYENRLKDLYTGCSIKSSPLNFFAPFSAMAWNFNAKFCTLIYSS